MIEEKQNLLTASPDILMLELNISIDPKPIYVVNLYNTQAGFAKAGEAVTAILGADTFTQQTTLWAGECNLHFEDWDAHTRNPTVQVQIFAEWVTNNGTEYGLDIGIVINRQVGTLDLVIPSRL